MKLKNIFFGLTAAVATMCMSSCDAVSYTHLTLPTILRV